MVQTNVLQYYKIKNENNVKNKIIARSKNIKKESVRLFNKIQVVKINVLKAIVIRVIFYFLYTSLLAQS